MHNFQTNARLPATGRLRPAPGREWVPMNENYGLPDSWSLYTEGCGWAQLVLNESGGNGRTVFRGKFQEHSALNKNRRMYTERALKSNVDKLMETVTSRSLYGELDHPTDSVIHLRNASHIVTKLWWEGNVLMGEGEILNTPAGQVLKQCMAAGGRIGISSRGVGNGETRGDGVLVIDEQYKLITFDAVADPSTFQAFQQKVVGGRSNETFDADQRMPEVHVSGERLPARNESYGIDTVNKSALVSFIGCRLDSLVADVRRRLRV